MASSPSTHFAVALQIYSSYRSFFWTFEIPVGWTGLLHHFITYIHLHFPSCNPHLYFNRTALISVTLFNHSQSGSIIGTIFSVNLHYCLTKHIEMSWFQKFPWRDVQIRSRLWRPTVLFECDSAKFTGNCVLCASCFVQCPMGQSSVVVWGLKLFNWLPLKLIAAK